GALSRSRDFFSRIRDDGDLRGGHQQVVGGAPERRQGEQRQTQGDQPGVERIFTNRLIYKQCNQREQIEGEVADQRAATPAGTGGGRHGTTLGERCPPNYARNRRLISRQIGE